MSYPSKCSSQTLDIDVNVIPNDASELIENSNIIGHTKSSKFIYFSKKKIHDTTYFVQCKLLFKYEFNLNIITLKV